LADELDLADLADLADELDSADELSARAPPELVPFEVDLVGELFVRAAFEADLVGELFARAAFEVNLAGGSDVFSALDLLYSSTRSLRRSDFIFLRETSCVLFDARYTCTTSLELLHAGFLSPRSTPSTLSGSEDLAPADSESSLVRDVEELPPASSIERPVIPSRISFNFAAEYREAETSRDDPEARYTEMTKSALPHEGSFSLESTLATILERTPSAGTEAPPVSVAFVAAFAPGLPSVSCETIFIMASSFWILDSRSSSSAPSSQSEEGVLSFLYCSRISKREADFNFLRETSRSMLPDARYTCVLGWWGWWGW